MKNDSRAAKNAAQQSLRFQKDKQACLWKNANLFALLFEPPKAAWRINMNIGELRTFGYTREYASQKTGTAAFAEAYALKIKEKDEKDNASASYAPEQQVAEVKQGKTESEIIVKPDGSRILVITMIQGVSKTAISMKISKPTHLPNENKTAGDQDTPTENTENVIQNNASVPI